MGKLRLTYLDDDQDMREMLDEYIDEFELPFNVTGVELFADLFEHLPNTDVLVMDVIGVLGGMYNIDDRQIESMFLHIREHYAGPIFVYSGRPGFVDCEELNLHDVTKGVNGFSALMDYVQSVVQK